VEAWDMRTLRRETFSRSAGEVYDLDFDAAKVR
jgi:hypothetical protein